GRRARRDEGARLSPSSLRRSAAEGGGVVRWQESSHPGVLRTPPLLIQGGETHEGSHGLSFHVRAGAVPRIGAALRRKASRRRRARARTLARLSVERRQAYGGPAAARYHARRARR